MMKEAATVVYRSLIDTYDNFGIYVWCSLFWLLSIIPIVTLVPATMGLLYVIKLQREGLNVRPSDFWNGMKKHFGIGLRLTLLYVLISVPGFFSLFLLIGFHSFIFYLAAVIVLYFLGLFHFMFLYILPIIVEKGKLR